MKPRAATIIATILGAAAVFVGGATRWPFALAEPSSVREPQAKLSVKTAPNFRLRSLDGRLLRLSDYRGRTVVLNFWASWCAPCRVEMPWFVELYNQYKAKGLEVLGVAMDTGGKDKVVKFAKEINVSYTILLGNRSVADAYGGLRLLPQTFFIDRDGRMAGSMLGMTSRESLTKAIEELIGATY